VPRLVTNDAWERRCGDLLKLLLSHDRIDPRALDAQGRTFLFQAVPWANSPKDLLPLLRRLQAHARRLRVSVNHQVSAAAAALCVGWGAQVWFDLHNANMLARLPALRSGQIILL
jgi:hypothetical protein